MCWLLLLLLLLLATKLLPACLPASCLPAQVLYSIPGADITHAPSRAGTVVLNLIFIFGLLVSSFPSRSSNNSQQLPAGAYQPASGPTSSSSSNKGTSHLCQQPSSSPTAAVNGGLCSAAQSCSSSSHPLRLLKLLELRAICQQHAMCYRQHALRKHQQQQQWQQQRQQQQQQHALRQYPVVPIYAAVSCRCLPPFLH